MRRTPRDDWPKRGRQDHAVQSDQRAIPDQLRHDRVERAADRYSAAASDHPAWSVAQLSDHLDLPSHVGVREHPLRPAVETRLSLLLLASAGPPARAECGSGAIAGRT